MSFINTLNLWQWIVLGLVPPAIIALYFLKLRRRPVEVPSTYLWSRTIEDLHVNSIWQRLRQNLLLLLQLLLLALLMLALGRPGLSGARLVGDRFVLLIDTSASMSATDVQPTRFDAAQQRAVEVIERMEPGDVAMVISFSDSARVEQSFTDDAAALRRAVRRVRATSRSTDLAEALRAAAGLANPGRSSEPGNNRDVQVADALPATLYLFTDGGFAAVPEFSLGNLEPRYVPIGSPQASNAAIAAFSAERNPDRPQQLQAYARLENHSPRAREVGVSLYRGDQLIDASRVALAAGGGAGVAFDLPAMEDGVLKLAIDESDDLSLDNAAYAVLGQPREGRLLAITAGSDALRLALDTETVRELAAIEYADPAELSGGPAAQRAAAGVFDLVIYDRCSPADLPQANTLFLGALPPAGWSQGPRAQSPQIIDTDRLHPLMQYLELGDVAILEAAPVTGPAGTSVLIDADAGPLLAIAPREGFEDAVLGFSLVGEGPEGELEPKTDWPIRRSFPVFVINAVRYLGGAEGVGSPPSVLPGRPVPLRLRSAAGEIAVETPDGRRLPLTDPREPALTFTDTVAIGPYAVRQRDGRVVQRFAVNLFDSRESQLAPRESIDLGHEQVTGQPAREPARREYWKWLLAAGLVVLVFEWYVYNRRVYL